MSSATLPPSGAVELRAEFRVSEEHPCLAGHFPGKPVVPAVVLLDLLVSELLTRLPTLSGTQQHTRWRLAGIVMARFQSPLLPNEVLSGLMRVDMTTQRAQVQASVGKRAVATATLQLAQVDDEAGSTRT